MTEHHWLRFPCRCGYTRDTPMTDALREACHRCGEIVEAVPFTVNSTGA